MIIITIPKAGRFRNHKASGVYSDYSIVKINQNTEKSPRDLRRLTITQIHVKDHQLVLVGKTCKE